MSPADTSAPSVVIALSLSLFLLPVFCDFAGPPVHAVPRGDAAGDDPGPDGEAEAVRLSSGTPSRRAGQLLQVAEPFHCQCCTDDICRRFFAHARQKGCAGLTQALSNRDGLALRFAPVFWGSWYRHEIFASMTWAAARVLTNDGLHPSPPPTPTFLARLLLVPSRHLDHAGVVDALMPRLLGLLRSGTGLVSFASL